MSLYTECKQSVNNFFNMFITSGSNSGKGKKSRPLL